MPPTRETRRPDRRIYDEAVRTHAGHADGGERLPLWQAVRPLIPILIDAMEGHSHLDPDRAIKMKLLQMNAATIDRELQFTKARTSKARRRGVAGSELRRSVAIQTFGYWGDPARFFGAYRATSCHFSI